jgi:hypothetical protein
MRKQLTWEERKQRRKKSRGVPAPPTFSLAELADDVLLTQKEVAAWTRQSITWTEKNRYEERDGLEWRYVNGKPLCVAGSLKKAVKGDPTIRRPPVKQHAVMGND